MITYKTLLEDFGGKVHSINDKIDIRRFLSLIRDEKINTSLAFKLCVIFGFQFTDQLKAEAAKND